MIHILTLTWNGSEKIGRLKPGLYSNLEGLDFTWHIRDNGSKDNTAELVKSFDNCVLYEIGHNRDSFSAGMNYLFDKANPDDNDLILLLNNDIIFKDSSSVKNMINLQRKTNAGVVGAKLLYKDGKIQHCGCIMSKRYGCMPWHLYRGEPVNGKNIQKNKYFQAVTAAVSLIKTDAWRREGGFDEGFRWAFEDVDLNLRIGKTEKIVYCGETNIIHEESATLKRNNYNKLFLQGNVRHFKKKWWKNGNPTYKIDHELYLKNPNYNLIK